MDQFNEHSTLDRSHDWRVRALHRVARALGVLIHIDGMPYGSQRLMRKRGLLLESGQCQQAAMSPAARDV